MKKTILIVAAAAMAAGVLVAAPVGAAPVASSPTSTTVNVTPYIDRDLQNPGGNVNCSAIGVFDYSSDRTDYDVQPGNQFAVVIYDRVLGNPVGSADVDYDPSSKLLDWTATIPVEAVIVKGSNDANIYEYGLEVFADTGLGAPLTNPDDAASPRAGLSNITFCSNPQEVVPPEGNWCSPGYWRQPQHLDSWAATGISPTELYSDYLSVPFAKAKKNQPAPNPNATLLDVLQNPQLYGGDAFNAVGDLLSDAHPDVNWQFGDDRYEDTCPLS